MDALHQLHVYVSNYHWHWIAIGFLTYQINLGINGFSTLKYHGNTNISTKFWKCILRVSIFTMFKNYVQWYEYQSIKKLIP
jgi:hypothetical protein